MRKWIAVCCLFTLSVCMYVSAQTSINGKLVEAGSGVVVDYADILLFTSGSDQPVAHTFPDATGSFTIDNLKEGEYSLLVKLIGFDIQGRSGILVRNNAPVDLGVIEMKPLEVGLAEVEIVARKRQVIYKLDKKVIEASSNLLSSGGSAVDILENTPSIRVDAEGEVTFRGSSGFIVYVDGKPSVFSGTQALEQIPSSHIENIEIITTPSARYDTDGDVGIINIITKKQSNKGVSGMVNLSGSTMWSRNIDFLVMKQNEAVRWYVGGRWNERLRESDFNQRKTTIVADTVTTSHSKGPRKSNNFDYALRTGWMYDLASTSLSVEIEGGYGGRTRKGVLDYTEERTVKGAAFGNGIYDSSDDYDLHETYFQGTIAGKHAFNKEGHEISASFYLKYGGNALEYFESELYDKQGVLQQGHKAWEDEHRWTVRGNLDYTFPYRPGGRLEAGYQYFSYLEDGDYSMQFYNPVSKEFYWRDDIYNTFYFQRGVNTIYALLGEIIGSFEAQAGVRAEHTHRVLRSSIEGANRVFNRFEFFPSAHIGYHFPRRHVVLFSYSRRTTRPDLFYMEPYITYRDFYSAEIGNPDVRPEYINSFELNYRKNADDFSISASAFHRSRKDKIERLRIPFEAGVTLDSMANVGHDYATGVELSLQVQPLRVWGINVNGSLYHYKVKNQFKLGRGDETSTNYDITWNNSFELGKLTRLQVDGNFVGPSVTTQGRTDAFWYVNLAVRQQFLKRKLTGTLAFRDVFNSARYVSDIQTADLASLTKIRPKYPLIILSLSYTFNNYSVKTTKRKETHDLFEGTNH